ncbi:MAG: AgmX/PglI C-terminal domain-containing protein [Deltaproteobacteria bacterium]|nr:AgmX/PglI C-terminal domain-containing protein [Deltaproteobacteria bacterium]
MNDDGQDLFPPTSQERDMRFFRSRVRIWRWLAELDWAVSHQKRRRATLEVPLAVLFVACVFGCQPAEAGADLKIVSDSKIERLTKQVHTEPGELPRLKIAGDSKLELPLEHTHVSAKIKGYVARVEVTQTYKNDNKSPIEAIYVFPLPENSAVDDMKIVIGDRVIQAEIQKRADARRTYETAKNQGHTAALLEQERPNVFTQSVANIAPGTKVKVVVQYLQDLTYDAGEYEFVFPMVVGPRFMPGDPLPGPQSGSGKLTDTTQVPDASRISPPILGAGMRSGHDISLELEADAGLPIKAWDAPTHETVTSPTLDGKLKLKIADKDSLPNRDFVLRYAVDGKEPQATALTERDDKGGYMTLIVQPPKLDIEKLVGQREIIFVVDVSGSMHGVPLAMCKDAMREALRQLRPVDTFNIYSFSGSTGSAFKQPMPANTTNILQGTEYVTNLQAGGGTYMADAVKAALGTGVERGRTRFVFFMTDGYVGNEAQIIADAAAFVKLHKQDGHKARVFGFGVGSSVNRYLLDGLGKEGEGLTVYATTREDPVASVNKFYKYIDSPVIENMQVDWNGLQATEVFPAKTPDLFASHPMTLHARIDGKAGAHTIFVRGEYNGKKIELPVQVNVTAEKIERAPLATLWARSKIGDLERDLWNGERQDTVDAITTLGLGYRMVTKYTSFVAVDRATKVDGKSNTIVQPVLAPEGVDPSMAGPGQLAQNQAVSRSYNVLGAMKKESKAMEQESYGGLGARGVGIGGGGYGEGRGSIGGKSGYAAPSVKAVSPPPSPSIAPPMTIADVATEVPAGMDRRDADKGEKTKGKPREKAPEPAKPQALLVNGAIDQSAVMSVLTSHKAEIRKCFESAGQTGTVTLRWFITAEGVALQVKLVSSSSKDQGLEQCLAAKVKTWSFPKAAQSNVEITFTFRFPE